MPQCNHLSNGRTRVSANGLNALCVEARLLLLQGLVHEANVALLGLQDTRKVHLWSGDGNSASDNIVIIHLVC